MNEKQRRSGRPTVPRRSREELVTAIVAAATDVFAAGENPTVRAIAAHAGVQPSVIYRYFASKRALLGEVVARGSRHDAELIVELLGGPPERLVAAALANTPYRAALLRGVLAGLGPADVPGGLPSVELTARGLMQGKYTPARPDEQFDPRLITAFLAAALVGWQATGSFFTEAVGLGAVNREEVLTAVAGLLDQVYGLSEPGRRMEDGQRSRD
jgi:AcrR family transcriptional regulator